ncbi:MAG: hypothetical protein N2D54_08775, partial [Chloroflexota bacterium]
MVVPPETPGGDSIMLIIFDEVTGLPFNNQQYKMAKHDASTYKISLQARIGSVIKYVYQRQSAGTMYELTPSGNPIRYRMHLVNNTGEVQDTISRWSDISKDIITSGRIKGTVTDILTGLPVSNILIFSGGEVAITDINGDYLLADQQPGKQAITIYSMDGAYKPIQQLAIVAANSATQALFKINHTALVNVNFSVTVPEDTIAAFPPRIAGNLSQLGNTFTDLGGGISGLVNNMPALVPIGGNKFFFSMQLPAGTEIVYKYTLGDGFWNAERGADQNFAVRQIIIPDGVEAYDIKDSILSWNSPSKLPIWFNVTAPQTTPIEEQVYIQFNINGWMSPLPIWMIEPNRWVYPLLSPIDFNATLSYRYCRNGQCGAQFPIATEDINTIRKIDLTSAQEAKQDIIPAWHQYKNNYGQPAVLSNTIKLRPEEFVAGISYLPTYHPNYESIKDSMNANLSALSINTLVLTPTWTAVNNNPPVFQQTLENNVQLPNLELQIANAQNLGINPYLFPQLEFPSHQSEWWNFASRNDEWWHIWFEQYQNFISHFAQVAEANNIDTLIIGGSWLSPALPRGTLFDGSNPNTPGNSTQLWLDMIQTIRSQYSGDIT